MKDTRRKETAAAAAAHPIYGLARRLPPMETRILLMSQDSPLKELHKNFLALRLFARETKGRTGGSHSLFPRAFLFSKFAFHSLFFFPPSPTKLRFTSRSPKFSVNLSSLSGARPGLLGRPGVPSSQPNFDSIYGLFLTRSFI